MKGRFQPVKIDKKEAQIKLCKVVRKRLGANKIPYIVTHDGRTIRFPHPDIKQNDSVKLNLETNEVDGVIKFDNGASIFVQGGNNIGRVGILQNIEAHAGSYDIAHVKDASGRTFATRKENIFVIGAKNPEITLPKRQGVKQTLLEERNERIGRPNEEESESDEQGEEAAASSDEEK